MVIEVHKYRLHCQCKCWLEGKVFNYFQVSLASKFCTRSVETSQEVLTGYSIPQMVPSATVLFYPENGTCLVEWKWPEETIPTLQNFIVRDKISFFISSIYHRSVHSYTKIFLFQFPDSSE